MRARKPAATDPERATAPLPGTIVADGLAVGVGATKEPVLLDPDPPPTLPEPVPVAAAVEPVPVGVASRELCEPGRPVPTPGLPPAREVGTLTLVVSEPRLEEADPEADEPELAVLEAEAELLLEDLW